MSKISVRNLEKSYFIGKEEYKVLKYLNVEFYNGEFVAIYGESGSGKSTFMNVVGGLDIFQNGDILIEGQNIEEFTSKSMDYYRNRKVGFIFQEFNLLDNLTLLDNVILPMNISGLSNSEAKGRAKELLIKVGLGDHIKKRVNQLSGGQKQRVAIARALANDPDIILADEPTGALDSKTGVEILELLKQIASEGKCVIAITHSEKVSEFATRVVTLVDGKIVENNQVSINELNEIEEYKVVGEKNRLSFSKTMKIAYRNLMSRKFRTFIVAIGVSIGITGSILISSLSSSAINEVTNAFSGMEIDPTQTSVVAASADGTPVQISEDTTNTIEAFVGDDSGLEAILPEYVIMSDVEEDNTSASASPYSAPLAVTYADKKYTTIEYGNYPKNELEVYFDGSITSLANLPFSDKFIKKIDLNELSKFDPSKKDDIFLKYENIVEKEIVGQTFEMTVDGEIFTFKIVGSKPLTKVSFSSNSNSIFLPYDTSSNFIENNKNNFIVNTYVLDFDTKESCEEFLDTKGNDSLMAPTPTNGMYIIVIDIRAITELINTIISVVRNVFLVLISVSLVVSVFMVAVIVYISTLERKVEIGTLRALGAKRSNIANIFIGEGIFIGIISFILALIGSAFGLLVINGILYMLKDQSGDFFTFIIDIKALFAIFTLIMVIMFISSIVPAMSASKQNPIDALREE